MPQPESLEYLDRFGVPVLPSELATDAAAAASAVGPQAIRGVLIAPMRERGVELFVSVGDVTPWGTMLTIGLGGIWVELLDDVVSRLLPVSQAEVLAMLRALRGRRLLEGARGARPVNLNRVAEVVVDIVAAATSLGPRLQSIEINPLLADGDTVSVLDALILVRDA